MPSNDPLDESRTRLEQPEPGAPTDASSEPSPNGADSWDDFDELPPADEPSPTTSSRDRTRFRGFTDPAVFAEPIGAAVGMASVVVHYARKAPADLWIADDDDIANIAGPLARIAARHSPIAGGEASDLADGISAALGVANYAVKNIRATAQLAPQAPLAPMPNQEPAPPEPGSQPFPGPPA